MQEPLPRDEQDVLGTAAGLIDVQREDMVNEIEQGTRKAASPHARQVAALYHIAKILAEGFYVLTKAIIWHGRRTP